MGESATCSSSATPTVDASSSCFLTAYRILPIPFSSRRIRRQALPLPPASLSSLALWWATGWPGTLDVPCSTGQHGLKISP